MDLEDAIAELLRRHYKAASWAARRNFGFAGPTEVRLGRWSCACGADGVLHLGQKATTMHRRHLAREIMRLVKAGVS